MGWLINKGKNTETPEAETTAEESAVTLTAEQDELLRAVEMWAREKRGEPIDQTKLFVDSKHRKNTEILVSAGYLEWVESGAKREHVRLSESARNDFELLGTIF